MGEKAAHLANTNQLIINHDESNHFPTIFLMFQAFLFGEITTMAAFIVVHQGAAAAARWRS